MRSTVLTVSFACLASCATFAGNWPSWRGPNQNNISPETNFPTRWSRTENVKWRAELPEAGNSSPIVWGDTVFVTQAVDDGKRRTLMAFDRKTGKQRWQQGVAYDEVDPRHKTNPHCSASPVTDGERVIASFASAGIVAYDFSGKPLWKADLGKQRHDWGQGSSPVIHGDSVIVYHGPGEFSALHALDKRTGAKQWTVPLKEQHPAERFDGFAGKNDGALGTFSTPLIVSANGRDEIILPVANKVRAFAPADGRELWSADGINPLVYASTTYGDGTLVTFGGFFGGVVFLKPGGEGDVTAKRLFHEQRMKKHTIGSPVIKDGHIYLCVTDGFLQCYELATGKMVFEERLPATGGSSATWGSPVLVGDRLYVVNQSGDTLSLRAAPRYELLASNPLGELSNATPAFSDGQVFIRTHTALYCVAEGK
jgi:outer membrane protein assembly factor BamB